MEWWFLALPFVLVALFCVLMMGIAGRVFGRGRLATRGSGLMMCHGGHDRDRVEADELLAEMKSQRDRLDGLIARAEEAANKTSADGEPESA